MPRRSVKAPADQRIDTSDLDPRYERCNGCNSTEPRYLFPTTTPSLDGCRYCLECWNHYERAHCPLQSKLGVHQPGRLQVAAGKKSKVIDCRCVVSKQQLQRSCGAFIWRSTLPQELRDHTKMNTASNLIFYEAVLISLVLCSNEKQKDVALAVRLADFVSLSPHHVIGKHGESLMKASEA